MIRRCDQKKMHLECEFLLSFKYMCETALKLISSQTMHVKGHSEGNISRKERQDRIWGWNHKVYPAHGRGLSHLRTVAPWAFRPC